MLFNYKSVDTTGVPRDGAIEAINIDVAISSLQRRGLAVSSIKPEEKGFSLGTNIAFLDRVSNKDIVILSRQLATLFEAQISALRIFRLLAGDAHSHLLSETLSKVADDIQGGSSISAAMAKHPKIFSTFYISMIRSGEESGKLNQIFSYLADYLDRTYEVTSKVKGALIYPGFVIFTFVTVMILMLTVVIPKITAIIVESGQQIPIYTQIVIGLSNFFVNYGIIIVVFLIVGVFFFIRYIRTQEGGLAFDRFKISVPYLGSLYQKLYLSRIADNLNTMLMSAIPIVHALEITADVVGNKYYQKILLAVNEDVKGGSPLSVSMGKYKEMPSILIQMMKVGEESGELGSILENLAKFYRREVTTAVDTMVGLIEPVMIVGLGVGVAILLASVLLPIYNISSA
ncbi:MAG: type II secretion system F family protein [Candidatus Taylorbacteria bacterium]